MKSPTATYDKLKAIIQKYKWYDQGGSAKFLYQTVALVASCLNIKNIHAQGYERFITFNLQHNCTWGLEVQGLKHWREYIFKKDKADEKFFSDLKKMLRKKEKELDAAIKKLNLEQLSDDELKLRFKQFGALFEDAWKPFVFIDAFDLNWEGLLNNLLQKHYPDKLNDEEIKALLMPEEMSYTKEEEISLLKLKTNFSEAGLKKHQQKFYYYNNSYSYVEEQSIDHFRERLKEIKNPKEDIARIEKYQNDVKEAKKQIIAKHKIPKEVMHFINMLVIFGKQRDRRKSIQCRGNIGLKRFVDEIARRRNIKPELLEQLSYHHFIEKAFEKSEAELKKINFNCCGLYDEDEGAIVVYGEDAVKLKEVYEETIKKESAEIKGTPAYNGIVKGHVRIIMHRHEFSKMQQGEILVTYNTRPEFVPIMKKAAAIVTNEGGITSHAAVVSRELRIPCIVGTHIATKVLKDGDVVEVDANQGIVKKIQMS